MKTRIILLFIFLGTILSCNRLPSTIDEEYWYQEMMSLVGSYNRTYFSAPESADDLIRYLELENGFLSEEMFYGPYEFLKKNHKRIVFTTDDELIYMYYRKVKPKNLIVWVSNSTACGDPGGMGWKNFYNLEGDIIFSDLVPSDFDKALMLELSTIKYGHPDINWERNPEGFHPSHRVIIVEYTLENGLRALCPGEAINVGQSEYFSKMSDILRDFCEEHSLSRIILDSYVPVE